MNCMAEDHIGGSPVADRSNTDAVGIWKSVARQKDRVKTEIGIKNGADVMTKTEDMCMRGKCVSECVIPGVDRKIYW